MTDTEASSTCFVFDIDVFTSRPILQTILAGDVGGTNTRFQLYEVSRKLAPMLKQNEK